MTPIYIPFLSTAQVYHDFGCKLSNTNSQVRLQ
jgi:hypothetical protein